MRFNNGTNIPNKIIQKAIDAINETDSHGVKVKKPAFSFVDAYGVTTATYKIDIDGFPTIYLHDVDNKYYNVTTIGNDRFYNIDKDGKKLPKK